MIIEGITVCVNRADQLKQIIPINKSLFSRWLIVTCADDVETGHLIEQFGLTPVLFSDHSRDCFDGGFFQKSSLISKGLESLSENAWCLLIDSDIALPLNLRGVCEATCVDKHTLYAPRARRFVVDLDKVEQLHFDFLQSLCPADDLFLPYMTSLSELECWARKEFPNVTWEAMKRDTMEERLWDFFPLSGREKLEGLIGRDDIASARREGSRPDFTVTKALFEDGHWGELPLVQETLSSFLGYFQLFHSTILEKISYPWLDVFSWDDSLFAAQFQAHSYLNIEVVHIGLPTIPDLTLRVFQKSKYESENWLLEFVSRMKEQRLPWSHSNSFTEAEEMTLSDFNWRIFSPNGLGD